MRHRVEINLIASWNKQYYSSSTAKGVAPLSCTLTMENGPEFAIFLPDNCWRPPRLMSTREGLINSSPSGQDDPQDGPPEISGQSLPQYSNYIADEWLLVNRRRRESGKAWQEQRHRTVIRAISTVQWSSAGGRSCSDRNGWFLSVRYGDACIYSCTLHSCLRVGLFPSATDSVASRTRLSSSSKSSNSTVFVEITPGQHFCSYVDFSEAQNPLLEAWHTPGSIF